ncbi:MAG: hypothetical protein JKX85_05135 [Phycisphaeraceae bacterium]|nr:hypothetical protein [Phycisphaeraceae bacterium]
MCPLLKNRSFVAVLLLSLIPTLEVQSQATAQRPAILELSQQDVLLNQDGTQQKLAREQLNELQNQINLQIQQSTNPREQFVLLEQRLKIMHTLAVDARLNQQLKHHARWYQAMRSDAWKLRQSENPELHITGDYWFLLCDLSDIRRLARDLESSQRACIQRLEQFLEKQTRITEPNEPQAMHLLQQVRLALLQLYDQRGSSSQACKLISRLKQLDPENQPLLDDLQQTYGYCHLIGTRFNTRLITADGKAWDSREKRGTSIVIYFWPGIELPTVPTNKANNQYPVDSLWNQMHQTKAEVLLVDLSHADESGLQIPASPWPKYRQEPGQFKLTDYFHVKTLPRIVIIDKQGVIQAIGGPATNNILQNLATTQ